MNVLRAFWIIASNNQQSTTEPIHIYQTLGKPTNSENVLFEVKTYEPNCLTDGDDEEYVEAHIRYLIQKAFQAGVTYGRKHPHEKIN